MLTPLWGMITLITKAVSSPWVLAQWKLIRYCSGSCDELAGSKHSESKNVNNRTTLLLYYRFSFLLLGFVRVHNR